MPPRLGAWQPGRPLHGRRRNEWIVGHHVSDSPCMSRTPGQGGGRVWAPPALTLRLLAVPLLPYPHDHLHRLARR
jgi:hypothetical protein